jgi:hypothetical protein
MLTLRKDVYALFLLHWWLQLHFIINVDFNYILYYNLSYI